MLFKVVIQKTYYYFKSTQKYNMVHWTPPFTMPWSYATYHKQLEKRLKDEPSEILLSRNINMALLSFLHSYI